MDKTDYFDKMDALVNDKQAYEELERDPTPALQRKLKVSIRPTGFFIVMVALYGVKRYSKKNIWILRF